MTDAATRLLGKGAPIKLADGTETHVRFQLLAMRELLEVYGSIGNMEQAIQQLLGPAAQSESEMDLTKEGVDLLILMRRAGLSHLQMDDYELEEALSHMDLIDQMQVIFQAFDQGNNSVELAKNGRPVPKDHLPKKSGTGIGRSPGKGSTTSVRPSSTEPMSSSGT
jgi:hypothetical protein